MAMSERRARVSLVLFIAGNVLFATGLIVHAFLYNFYLEALDLPATVLGYAAAALTAGSLVTLIPGGVLADRAGPKTTVVTGALVLTLGLGLGAVATSPFAVYGAAAIAGAGSAFWRVAMAPVLMRLTQARTRPRAFAWNVGLLTAWYGLGVWLGGAVVAWLEARWGLPHLVALRMTLLVGAAGSATSLLLYLALRFPADVPVPDGPGVASAHLGSHLARKILPLIGLLALWMLGSALCAQFLNIFFSHTYKLSIERIGLIFATSSWCWALAVLASGELAKRIGVGRILFASLIAFTPAIWGLAFAPSLGFAIALYFVQGVLPPLTTPLIDQWLLGQVPPERQGAVSSWRQVAADVSAMLGASAGGRLLAVSSYRTLFLVAGAISFLGAAGVIAITRARRVKA